MAFAQIALLRAQADAHALEALCADSDPQLKRDLVSAMSALYATPRDSLARRLIELAPPKERAYLREQLL